MIELIYGGSGSGKSEFAENEILRYAQNDGDCHAELEDNRCRPHFVSASVKVVPRSLFYIATMKVRDDEARRKVAHHRKLRAGKNFITIEASENLENAAETILQLSCHAKLEEWHVLEKIHVAKDCHAENENRHAELVSASVEVEPVVFIDSGLSRNDNAEVQNICALPPEQKSCVLLECLSNLAANEMFLENGEIVEPEIVARKIESGLEKLFSVADNIVIMSNNIFDDGIDYDETTREYQKTLAKLNNFVARRADKVSEIVAGIEVRVK